MEYKLESAFCDDLTRQFVFILENKLIDFINQPGGIIQFNMTNTLLRQAII